MREKTVKLIVTFHTTTAAMAMETLCKERGVPGRLIPVPRAITAGCGLSWCAPTENRPEIEALVQSEGLATDGLYELPV
ncbi:MAG: DUF3343 domain-containing protein [Oscillospiraceae bacterium]